MILVVGATGLVGGEVCRRLAARGIPARALVRATSDPAKVEALRSLGLDLVQGDLRDPASLTDACRGVSAVISTISSMPFAYEAGVNDITTTDMEGSLHLVDAARAAGVQHFVYTSFSGNIDLDFPLRNAKRTVEAYLKLSGMTYTILRPSYFMEVWLSPAVGFDAANAKATIYGDGSNPISWIALGDVAEFAVRSLDNPAARNAILELGGPAALTPRQVVGIYERVLGRPFETVHVPAEALASQQSAATDPMQQSFTGLMRCYASGDAIDIRPTLRDFPVTLTAVDEHAEASARAMAVPV
jgi:NADH dehydrogenase